VLSVVTFILWKTGVFDLLTTLFAKDKNAALNAFDAANNTGSSTWSAEKIRSDANQIADALGWRKRDGILAFVAFSAYTEDEDTAFGLVKNYTNPAMLAILVTAYRDLATDGRDLKADCAKYLTSEQIAYLRLKNII